MSDPNDRPADDAANGTPDDALGGALEDAPEFEHLSLEAEGDLAILELRREEALNALDGEMLLELGLALELIGAAPNVRALVLRGAGRGFCAGADLAGFANLRQPFDGREAALAGQGVANAIASLPFPTVAALHGFALGGGLELALACDLRVAAPGTRLGLPETTRGLLPGYGGTQRLPRIVGQGRALDLILTGRLVDAEEALAIGLVSRVEEDAPAAAVAIARATLASAPVALGLAKEAVVRGADVALAQGLEIEADLFGLVATTDDAAEGIASFLEKRDPEFEGR